MQDFWVFGYGSLMWRPGFIYRQSVPARLHGAHRSLCVYSHVHRGTAARPGLVLGLDRGGACRGIAYLVAGDRRDETVAYLRAREQVTMVYLERWRPVRLLGVEGGRTVSALCYTVDRAHPQYAGRLGFDALCRLARDGVGVSGASADYLNSAVRHLDELGIADPYLAALDKAVNGQ